jgi:FkbM family methyltransferase
MDANHTATPWWYPLKQAILRPTLYAAGLYFTYVQRRYRVGKLSFEVPSSLTDVSFRGWFTLGRYEREERRYLAKYLQPDASVLELGACLGVVSGLTNSLLEDPTRHVVVEANPAMIPWIKQNRATNESRYQIEQGMISEQAENTFFIDDVIVLGSTKRQEGRPVNVPGLSIAGLEQKHGFAFDTLVMDIEGGELDFFTANQAKLSQFRQIFMEVHPFGGMLTREEVQRCEDILRAAGLGLSLRDGNFQIWEKVETPVLA